MKVVLNGSQWFSTGASNPLRRTLRTAFLSSAMSCVFQDGVEYLNPAAGTPEYDEWMERGGAPPPVNPEMQAEATEMYAHSSVDEDTEDPAAAAPAPMPALEEDRGP
jgi:hypothetical protein